MTRGGSGGRGGIGGSGSGGPTAAAAAMSRSLNRGWRAKELRRVDEDNARLLRRIQAAASTVGSGSKGPAGGRRRGAAHATVTLANASRSRSA